MKSVCKTVTFSPFVISDAKRNHYLYCARSVKQCTQNFAGNIPHISVGVGEKGARENRKIKRRP